MDTTSLAFRETDIDKFIEFSEYIPGAFILFDKASYAPLRVNSGCVRLFGCETTDEFVSFINDSFIDSADPKDAALLRFEIKKVTNKEFTHFRFWANAKHGNVLINTYLRECLYDGHPAIYACLEDITQVVANEKDIVLEEMRRDTVYGIASALTASFEDVYEIDIRTNRFVCYRSHGSSLREAFSGTDFFSVTLNDIEKAVYETDKKVALQCINKELMLKNTEDKAWRSPAYRIMRGGIPVYYRMRVIRSGEKLIVTTENVESEMGATKEINDLRQMGLHFADTFVKAYYINLNTLSVTTFNRNSKMIYRYPDVPDYLTSMHEYIERGVHPDDKEILTKISHPDYLRRKLKELPSFTRIFKDVTGGALKYYRFQATRGEDENHAAVGFIDITEDYRRDERNRIITEQKHQLEDAKAFTDLFFDQFVSAYYVNLDDFSMTVHKQRSDLAEKYGRCTNFRHSIRRYIKDDVHPDDRELLYNATSPETIKRRLEKENEYSVVFRDMRNGIEEYYRLQVIRGKDPSHVAFGFSDIDEMYREQLKRQVDLERNMSIISVLASEYSSVLHVDTATGNITPYAISEEVADTFNTEYANSRQFETFRRKFIDIFVYEQDREMMLNTTSKENLMRELADSESFTTLFRMNENNMPYFCEMKIAKIAGGATLPAAFVIGLSRRDDEVSLKYVDDKLRSEYNAILLGDLDTGLYRSIKASTLSGFEKLHIGSFSEAMLKYSQIVTPEYRRFWENLSSLDYLREFLAYDDRRELVYTIQDSANPWRRAVFQIVDRNGSVPSMVLISFISIDQDRAKALELEVTVARQNTELFRQNELLEQQKRQLIEAKSAVDKKVDEQTALLREKNSELSAANIRMAELLGNIIELRDQQTGDHIFKVRTYTKLLAENVMKQLPKYELTPEKIALITSASALHDVGKILIPDSVLLKPAKLTAEEFTLMKTHSLRGCDVLRRVPIQWNPEYMSVAFEICRCHHEKWDGRGYPEGLKGDAIPISAQIVSLADCYDALTSPRPYKNAYDPETAFEMILNGDCGAFSPELTACFMNVHDDFCTVASSKT